MPRLLSLAFIVLPCQRVSDIASKGCDQYHRLSAAAGRQSRGLLSKVAYGFALKLAQYHNAWNLLG